jgi:hypothetical protein
LRELVRCGHTFSVIDPRGVGQSRPRLSVIGHDYADPLSGVEENIAYNAFLVGKSLLGMRVTDVLVAVQKLRKEMKPRQVVVCGRRDAALMAALAAAVEPTIALLATEEMLLSFRSLFLDQGTSINAASILPGLLERFGDIADVLVEVAPRGILVAAGAGEIPRTISSIREVNERFTSKPGLLTDWLARSV